jgi:3-oxoacyl-[acyl-carrier-protein] synthase II
MFAMKESRRVVVTGMGALTPVGLGVPAYWQGLLAGTSGAAPITLFDATKFKTRFACELKGFDIGQHMDRKESKRLDQYSQYALVAADEAIADAKLDLDKLDHERIGVIVGAGIGGLRTFSEEVGGFARGDGTPRFNPFFIPKMIADIAAGHISMKYDLRGPNYACVSACASGTNCIIDAWMLIRNGFSDIVISGGSEAAITDAGIGGFNAMKALSERNDDPATASRPFDKDRDGFVLGEGAGILVLEEYEHARKRGARIYAELLGVGMSADAYHMTAPHPEGRGVKKVMLNVLESSGLPATAIDHINTHGTSTGLGDVSETNAIKAVFGDHARNININSTKSMTGHLLGAAGAIESIATVLAVVNDIVPPTINHFTDDPECDLNYTFHTPVKRTVNAAISNTFGFGGHNTSVLFVKAPQE